MTGIPNRLRERPIVGGLVVPFMVDESVEPIDFKRIDAKRIEQCASDRRCGVCGKKMKGDRYAFLGPDDGRECFADPWMHEVCARYTIEHCSFVSGRRPEWRGEVPTDLPAEVGERYARSQVLVLAQSGGSHVDPRGLRHFAVRREIRRVKVR